MNIYTSLSLRKGVCIVGFIGLLLWSIAVPLPTNAQTSDVYPLQDIIDALIQQVRELQFQLQLQQNPVSGGVCENGWGQDLSIGSTGSDVLRLQQYLNLRGFVVSAGGPGSVGNETLYYGPATAAAVAQFQNAYAADILAPAGLSSGSGYFGPLTRAHLNQL
ncbi:MAG: peptidoglycan-binding domain-containing protein, partial [Bacteroidota bacterium]